MWAKVKMLFMSGGAQGRPAGPSFRISYVLVSLLTLNMISSCQCQDQDRQIGQIDSHPEKAKAESGINRLLAEQVDMNGKVNYHALRENPFALNTFIDFIHSVSPDNKPELFPTPNDRKAYWINAYNALVIETVIENPEAGSLPEISWGHGVFWRKEFMVGNQLLTLNDIENKKLRAGFHDPRIHFAINCGSKSCPPLGQRIFTGTNLDKALDNKTSAFVNDPDQVRVDSVNKVIYLSKIFKWYRKDFETSAGSVLDYLDRYSDQIDLTKSPEMRKWKIKYNHYDWSLNDL